MVAHFTVKWVLPYPPDLRKVHSCAVSGHATAVAPAVIAALLDLQSYASKGMLPGCTESHHIIYVAVRPGLEGPNYAGIQQARTKRPPKCTESKTRNLPFRYVLLACLQHAVSLTDTGPSTQPPIFQVCGGPRRLWAIAATHTYAHGHTIHAGSLKTQHSGCRCACVTTCEVCANKQSLSDSKMPQGVADHLCTNPAPA